MAALFPDKDRNIIPRWRPFHSTLALGEMNPLSSNHVPEFNRGILEKSIKLWRQNKTVAFAGELLSTALMMDVINPDISNAIAFVLKSNAPESTKDIARRIRETGSNSAVKENVSKSENWIKNLRGYLRANPKDPFAWVDYALAHTIAGNHEKAKRSMNVALGLSKNNRFILRSAARFYIHINDYHKANDIIRQNALSKHDPWLLAAELATSAAAERAPKFGKLAMAMTSNVKEASIHTSELFAALGMLEMSHGKHKKAKKNFESSLEKPTENTVAQVNFAVRRESALRINKSELHIIHSSEALTYEKYKDADWQGSLQESLSWQSDQPFSVRPIIHGTYLTACILEDYSQCLEIAELGLRSTPGEFGVLNNVSVALSRLGRVEEAVRAFKTINKNDLDESQRITFLATAGMINYRLGGYELGEKYYNQAIRDAKKLKYKELEVRAQLFFMREKVDAKIGVTSADISELESKLDKEDLESKVLLKNIKDRC